MRQTLESTDLNRSAALPAHHQGLESRTRWLEGPDRSAKFGPHRERHNADGAPAP